MASRAAQISRRTALGALGSAALAAALWPRTPRTLERIPAGRTIIDYWEKWTGPEGDAVQRLVDRFNDEQSRIWVRRVPVSDIASKAMVAIGGGDPPDVIGLYSYNLPQLAESGAIEALDAPAVHLGGAGLDVEAYLPSVRRLLTHQKRLWAGVSSCYSLALYYNRRLFREAGLNPDRPPQTTQDLDEAARVLTSQESGEITRAGFLQNLPAWWPYFWPIMFGGRLYDPDADRAILTDEPTIRAYEWVKATARRLGVESSIEFASSRGRSFHSPSDPFINGDVAMIVQGPWIANFLRRYGPDVDYGACPVPVDSAIVDAAQPRGLLEADVLVIPRGCRHPAEALQFVKFTQMQSCQEQLCTEHCKSSPLKEVSKEFVNAHPNRCVGVHDAIMRSDQVLVLPQTRVWQPYADMMLGMFDSIWRGADVKDQLARVENRANDILSRAATMRRARES